MKEQIISSAHHFADFYRSINNHPIFITSYVMRGARVERGVWRMHSFIMANSPYKAQLALAKEAAKVAGEIIRSYHSTSVGRCNNSAKVNVKSGVDLVTEADTRVEKVVTEMIQTAFPNDLIVGEEDQAESPRGVQGEDFPGGSIWCVGKLLLSTMNCIRFCYPYLLFPLMHFFLFLHKILLMAQQILSTTIHLSQYLLVSFKIPYLV